DTARGITLGTSDATLTVASGKTLTAASVIAGLSGADLTKSGTGTLVMSASNTYVGTTTVSQGIIDVGNASGLGGSASNQGTTVSANAGVLVANSGGLTIAEPLTISGTGPSLDGALRSGTGANTWSGAITLGADAEIQVDDQISWVSTLTLSGGVSGAFKLTLETVGTGASTISGAIATGTGSLEKTGTGTLTLSAANSYTGVTQISAGVVMLSGSGRLADTTAVTVDSLATFDLNDITDTVGSIAGAGSITLGSGTLTAGGDTSSTTFSGVISETGGFTKAGSGTLTLTGSNTFTGTLTISAGTVSVGSGGTTGWIAATTVANSGSITFNRSNSTTFTGVVSGTGSLTKDGTGTLTISG
ncbi:MAG: transporter, partial [Proteobacteria bacterium]|nr:transporter [Pseudomonadota bacterium]